METYFPSLFEERELSNSILPDLTNTYMSGEQGLRSILRNLSSSPNRKVFVSAFVCETVPRAILAEGYEVFKTDLISETSFWGDYSIQRIKQAQPKVVLLVHLYGFLHPQTSEVVEYCLKSNIHVIHDAAQCLGLNEKLFQGGSILYSFGPGKSSTAALGGWVKGNSFPSVKLNALQEIWINLYAKDFANSRQAKKNDLWWVKIFKPLAFRFFLRLHEKKFYSMTKYQKKAATLVIHKIRKATFERKKRWDFLREAIRHSNQSFICSNESEGLYFKLVLYAKCDPDAFAQNLANKKISFVRLFSHSNFFNSFPGLSHIKNSGNRFFELSTEATVPWSEIERIAREI